MAMLNNNNQIQYKSSEILYKGMRSVVCSYSQNNEIANIKDALFDGYKMLDGDAVNTTDKSEIEQRYINKLNSIQDKEHALKYYEKCINRFIYSFQASEQQNEINTVLDSCITEINEYNNNKSKNTSLTLSCTSSGN